MKKSGYQVTMTFLVPVDANDIGSMKFAHDTIEQISKMMLLQRDGGLIKALETSHKFVQRREVPDAPKPVEAGLPEVTDPPQKPEYRTTMPPIPAPLRRT